MLETIREFALERFDEAADAAELRRRHAEHFLALALEAQPSSCGAISATSSTGSRPTTTTSAPRFRGCSTAIPRTH